MLESEKLIRAYAKARTLSSLAAIARELGITRQSLSLLMQGKRVMSCETAAKICDALGMDLGTVVRRLSTVCTNKRKRQRSLF